MLVQTPTIGCIRIDLEYSIEMHYFCVIRLYRLFRTLCVYFTYYLLRSRRTLRLNQVARYAFTIILQRSEYKYMWYWHSMPGGTGNIHTLCVFSLRLRLINDTIAARSSHNSGTTFTVYEFTLAHVARLGALT